jgi:hypothetical protein
VKPPKFKGVSKTELAEYARYQRCKPEEVIVIPKSWLSGFRAGKQYVLKARCA